MRRGRGGHRLTVLWVGQQSDCRISVFASHIARASPPPKFAATPQRFPAGHDWQGLRRCGNVADNFLMRHAATLSTGMGRYATFRIGKCASATRNSLIGIAFRRFVALWRQFSGGVDDFPPLHRQSMAPKIALSLRVLQHIIPQPVILPGTSFVEPALAAERQVAIGIKASGNPQGIA